MARIFGYFTPEAAPEYRERAARYATSLAAVREPLASAVVRCLAPNTYAWEGLHVGFTGRPLWQGKVLSDRDPDGNLRNLLNRYRQVGTRLLDELEGPFALAILDTSHESALLALDRMGIERLCYAFREGSLVFGDSANAVADFPGIGRQLRQQALYDFLFMHMVPAPQTVFEGIYKLPPATALMLDNGKVSVHRYWEPSYDYAPAGDFSELKVALREGLATAVRDSGLDRATGAFLSGGLDSSSVAGTLARASETPARTFTVGFGDNEYDELKYSRIANEHFGCRAFEYQMSPADIVDAFPRIADAYDEPFGNSSAAPTFFCAKLAADNGVTHLLAGDGGDEVFGGNERYVRQWIFDLYNRLPPWLRRNVVEPATDRVSSESRITPLRKARSYVEQALIPLPERFESWNFMYREGGQHMLDADFAANIDREGPMRLMRKVWDAAPSPNLLEKMLWYDWHFTLADNDLRKVGAMCALAGVRVSYPLLHPAVVDLSTRVPPEMKIKGTELRTFFKKAMADFLPGEIIRKKKHGFGLPFGLWLKTDKALGDLIYSHLSALKRRGIVDADFIDGLIAQHRDGHAAYYGYAIWDLAMLEAWLVRHIDKRGQSY